MKHNITRNIRITNLKSAILCFILGFGPNLGFYFAVTEDSSDRLIMLVVFGLLALLMDYLFIKCMILVINPYKSNIFNKYGSVERLEEIMDEIEETIEYEDKQIIVSKNYVADKKDFEKILAYKDILRVHKLVHKTNFVVDSYSVIITDKYNFEISYVYPVKQEETVDKLIALIGSKCDNAKLGYTKEAAEYVRDNIEVLPKANQIKKDRKEDTKYACPDCKSVIAYGDKFCKNCGCKINWEENIKYKNSQEESVKEKNVEEQEYSITEIADAMIELSFKQIDDILPILKMYKIEYSFEKLLVTTIAYYSSIFLAHIGKTTMIKVKEYEILDNEIKEKAIKFIKNVFEDVGKEESILSYYMELFIYEYNKAKKEACESIDEEKCFVDKGFTDKYLNSFLNSEDSSKVKMYVLTQILSVWVIQAREGCKKLFTK